MSDPTRREFVTTSVLVAGACLICPECTEAADPPASTANTVDAGAIADYAKDGVFDKFAKKDKGAVLLIRQDGKLYAPTSICTHKNCALKVKEGVLTCPCHGSKYSNEGAPNKGPAKKSLARYAISKDDKGHVVVDKTKKFEQDAWGDEAAFIKLT